MLSETGTLPISRGLAGEIVTRLTAAILTGELGPGERLREEILAERLGVSRGPIREAFAQMERQGLLVIQRNRGAYVARLRREDVDEVYSLRLVLERLAIQRALKFAEPAHIAKMQAIVDKMAAYMPGVSEQEVAQDDIAFHDLIYQASKHERLYECWTNLRPQIQIMLLSRNVANPDFRDFAVTGHQAILDVLISEDEARAIQVIDDHLHVAYDRVMKSYGSQTTPGE
jgi:DNA-binding GntR family transcriptional regulator